MYLASFANADGTFRDAEKGIDYSPSAKTALQHFSKHSFYRLSSELKELGVLSWDREITYGRRNYRIHFDSPVPHGPTPEHVPHSQNQVPHSEKDVSDSQKHVPPTVQETGSMAENNPPLEPLPTENQNHPSEIDQGRSDDENSSAQSFSNADFKNKPERTRETGSSMKMEAFENLERKYSDCHPGYIWKTIEVVEQRANHAGSAPKSAKYYILSVDKEVEKYGYTKISSQPSPSVQSFQKAEDHVENCLRSLDAVISKSPALAEEFVQIRNKIAGNLQEVRENLKSVEILSQILDDTDTEIFDLLKKLTSEEDKNKILLEPDLQSYRSKVRGDAFAQIREQCLQKRLLEKYSLPRFGLYYMPDH
jgi:hypothetical protein